MTPGRTFASAFCFLASSMAAFSQSGADRQEDVMVVFDGSNSMWGQIDGTAKIEIARGVMGNLLGEWTSDRQVGLMAYGHRRRGDCTDIEMLIAPANGTSDAIVKRIKGITPTGKTPLTAAVEQAATQLSYTDRPATVVLISDGLESCERDPCALARALEKGGVGFTAHVVGFGLSDDADAASLACIAEETGGQYISASNASELGTALSTLGTAVAQEVVVAPAPEPEPEPEPALPEITLSGPNIAVAGSEFLIGWSDAIGQHDYVTIVTPDAEAIRYGTYATVSDKLEGHIRAPSKPGIYEMRYVHNDTKTVLGTRSIEITDPNVTLEVPQTALTGAEFDVSWTGAVHGSDYVTIVPVGAEQGEYASYVTVRDDESGTLTAAAEPGLYEVRYVLEQDAVTVATAAIEIVEASITLTAPERAVTGQSVRVGWSDAVSNHDYVTVIAVGADEGKYGNYLQVRDKSEGDLVMPADPGLYEFRYILREGEKTLARLSIEITEPEVTIDAPDSALAGEKFRVSWTGTVHPHDYVGVVPVGSDEGTYGNYVQVRDKTENMLQAPAETGLYEVRYILREGEKTLARRAIEITEPSVTISAPDAALAGSEIKVGWTGGVHPHDYITIVPVGADEGTFGNNFQVRDKSEGKLKMAGEPGLYELRYVLREGKRTLASRMIELSDSEVTLSAPASTLAGGAFEVSWTGAVFRHDYITIVAMGADEGTYGETLQVRDNSKSLLQAPAEPGLYELRYVLREGKRTLARATIEVSDAEVTISGPGEIRAGDTIKVSWTGAVHPHDYITIVPIGSPEGTVDTHIRARDNTEGKLKAPAQTGIYELRYVLNQGRRVMARSMIEVLSEDAQLQSGASLEAPDVAAPGASVEVSWSTQTSGGDQRITLAKADQAIFTWISAVKITGEPPVTIVMPSEPGAYELRFLDVSGQAVLARKVITVQ